MIKANDTSSEEGEFLESKKSPPVWLKASSCIIERIMKASGCVPSSFHIE